MPPKELAYNEKNISAEQYFQEKNAWLSRPYVHEEWPSRDQAPPRQRAQEAGRHYSIQINRTVSSGFPKEERIRKRVEFVALGAAGIKVPARNFLIIYRRAEGAARIGITVSRKVGNSVTRNRIKRLVREFYRHNKFLLQGAECNIIARQGAAHLDFQAVCRELDRLLRRIHHNHGN